MNARPQTIHRQVLRFAFVICSVILLAIGGVLFLHHLNQTRDRLTESLHSTARIVAANSSAAVAFRDVTASRENLRAFRYAPLVKTAVLYDKQGVEIAAFGQRMDPNTPNPELDPLSALRVDVKEGGERLGSLLVITDNRGELYRTAFTWAVVYTGAFGLSALLAVGLASRFQHAVADPIVSLAKSARHVTTNSDYSPHVVTGGPAEVVALAESFNTMLKEIGRRDEALASQLVDLNNEIQERKNAQNTLRQNTHEMLRLSREAGMAEVATGVLHNIGNALNSINVSAELLAEQLARRASSSTSALLDLFRTPTAKAAAVFDAHPAGSELRKFAVTYADHAHLQLTKAVAELSSLRVGVAHLKDIVARQQSLAKAANMSESFDLAEALNDAVLIDKTDGHRSVPGLKLERIEDASPPHLVYADRSAVVQIVINLLANARAAIAQAGHAEARITMRLHDIEGYLALSVIDTGIGIPPEQMLSIFSYGYTTKAGGHGFGLHNAANTARLLGGALQVESRGLGFGAAFTLKLPRRPPRSIP